MYAGAVATLNVAWSVYTGRRDRAHVTVTGRFIKHDAYGASLPVRDLRGALLGLTVTNTGCRPLTLRMIPGGTSPIPGIQLRESETRDFGISLGNRLPPRSELGVTDSSGRRWVIVRRDYWTLPRTYNRLVKTTEKAPASVV